jgi:hypothetical protein
VQLKVLTTDSGSQSLSMSLPRDHLDGICFQHTDCNFLRCCSPFLSGKLPISRFCFKRTAAINSVSLSIELVIFRTHKKRWRASKWTDKNGGHLLRRFSLSRQNRQLKCYGMVPFLLPATFFYASHGLIRFFV